MSDQLEALDPFSEDFLSNPHPYHKKLLAGPPVVRLERYGAWAVSRHKLVSDTLRDWETFCSSAGAGLSNFHHEEPWRTPSLLLEADPPDHTRVRTVVTQLMSRPVLAKLKDSMAEKADTLIDQLLDRDQVDGVEDLTRAFPLQVFPDAVGLKHPDREMLLPYADMAFNAFGPRNALLEKSMANAAPVMEWIAEQCQRESLTDDGIGAGIYAAAEAGEIEPEQAPLLVRSLLTAGVDTTIYGLGHALHCLMRNPDQWQLLRDNPALARNAFDEAIRLESPVQTFFRTTTRATEIGGTAIDADEKVLLFLAAANRDPRHWKEPDRYDITRDGRGHVGFGAGIHVCVGQMMAKLEGETLLACLARKVARLEPTGAPTHRLNNTLWGLATLPVKLIAA